MDIVTVFLFNISLHKKRNLKESLQKYLSRLPRKIIPFFLLYNKMEIKKKEEHNRKGEEGKQQEKNEGFLNYVKTLSEGER